MTSEVCIMNRQAIVLAADSATTVTRWTDRGREERYFKGANKIFQVSEHHPIGLMIYDGADIHNVPWEVIAKEFRRDLSDRSFGSVEEYAREFFRFLESDPRLFPMEVQRASFGEAARGALFRLVYGVVEESAPLEQQQADIERVVADEEARVAATVRGADGLGGWRTHGFAFAAAATASTIAS